MPASMAAEQLPFVAAAGTASSPHEGGVNPLGFGEGTLVGGRYRTGLMLGRGAMGVVFEATHQELGDRVAIKFLLPDHLANTEIVGRFNREAKAAVKLKGEHVARVLDVGKHDGGVPYIVMERLDGEDLGRRVDREGPLPVEVACAYAIEACAGLAEAHARGIVHRDVKPENLFLARLADGRQRVKILDFGVSKVALTGSALDEADLAATNTMLGSPLYMSPEQIRSKRVDHRSDIWSLGVSLYELLTGLTPFHSLSVAELIVRVLEEPPAPIRQFRDDVPEELDLVVQRCLARDPDERWENVATLAGALLPFASRASRDVVEQARALVLQASEGGSLPRISLPALAPSPPSVFPPALRTSTTSVTLPPPAPPAPRGARGRLLRGGALLTISVVLGVVGVAAVLLATRGSRPPPVGPTPAATEAVDSEAASTAVPLPASASAPEPPVDRVPSDAPPVPASVASPVGRSAPAVIATTLRASPPRTAPASPPASAAPPRRDGIRLTR